jgi:hypothetical protein
LPGGLHRLPMLASSGEPPRHRLPQGPDQLIVPLAARL